MESSKKLGAWISDGAARFRVWAPDRARVEIALHDDAGREVTRTLETTALEGGYFEASAPGVGAGALYKVVLDGEGPYPDPYARAQPLGVHGPSAIDGGEFAWTDDGWRGVPLEELVIYEVHVGAATPEGTFDALIARLGDIRAVGVTAIELMPVASFPGDRGWGYDGVDLFAPQASYGGPGGLRRLVDAAHAAGLGVILDCVYNHLGPDGNYLRAYAKRYFTDRHKTPWGDGVNFDGEGTAQVRALFLDNVEMWIREYHIDGLRLDATHAIVDDSTPHILAEIVERARAAGGGRHVVVIAEDGENDARLITPADRGGLGLDGVWADDFHHAARVAFAGDRDGYFEDFGGTAEELVLAMRKGWLYEGQLSAHWGKARGTPAEGASPPRFVHCIQNHDQVGNRALGDRLGKTVGSAAYRVMTAMLLLTPYTPLLFMGQEWDARTPFLYFTDHEPELGRLVTAGRRREFKAFSSFSGAEVPDPQERLTFERSKLDWSEREKPGHAGVLAWYRELLRLRASHPALRWRDRGAFSVTALSDGAVRLDRRGDGASLIALFALRGGLALDLGREDLAVVAFSEDPRFGGEGAPVAIEGSRLELSGPAAVILEAPSR